MQQDQVSVAVAGCPSLSRRTEHDGATRRPSMPGRPAPRQAAAASHARQCRLATLAPDVKVTDNRHTDRPRYRQPMAEGTMPEPNPWWLKPLSEMSADEWEALCDGCAKCCLHKLQDDDTDAYYTTDVVCRLLDRHSCRCSDYANRHRRVPDCIPLTPRNIRELDWMPATCAYRLRAAGQPLPDWHPLVSEDRDSVHNSGRSVPGRVVSEDDVDDPADRIVVWLDGA